MPTEDSNGVTPDPGGVTREHSSDEHVSKPIKASSGLRWRTVLLVLVASLGAALLSDVLVKVMSMTILGLEGTHVLHVLVTIPAAIWVARKVGTAPMLYGVVVGLFSGIANQVYNHAFEGTLSLYEVSVIMPMSVVAGGLGGVIARSTLAGQETLYRVSQAIGEASDLQGIVDAVGEHLADPQVSHVALW